MRKWKRDYLSMNNKTVWKKEDGMTLIELMASLAILSVVILLVGSVHIFGQRQFINQTESASQTNDMTYALSVMSRDLRKAEVATVSVEENIISLGKNPTYYLVGKNLMKKQEVLSGNVQSFLTEKIVIEDPASIEEDILTGVNITIITSGNGSNKSKDYQTTIYFRR